MLDFNDPSDPMKDDSPLFVANGHITNFEHSSSSDIKIIVNTKPVQKSSKEDLTDKPFQTNLDLEFLNR